MGGTIEAVCSSSTQTNFSRVEDQDPHSLMNVDPDPHSLRNLNLDPDLKI